MAPRAYLRFSTRYLLHLQRELEQVQLYHPSYNNLDVGLVPVVYQYFALNDPEIPLFKSDSVKLVSIPKVLSQMLPQELLSPAFLR
jgi:hypothetical protein